MFFDLGQTLSRLPKNVDRTLSQFALKQRVSTLADGTAQARRNQKIVAGVIELKQTLELVPAAAQALESCQSITLENIRTNVFVHPGLEALKSSIEKVIDEDIIHSKAAFVTRTQQCFAVKAGVDGFLDVARKAFCETTVYDLASRYREEFDLPGLKTPYNSKRGFYISIPVLEVQKLQGASLPKVFIQVTRHSKHYMCSSQELVSLNMRNKSAANECYFRTIQVLEGLCQRIREDQPLLNVLSESFALLDMLVNSFAYLVSSATAESYVRPELAEDAPIAIDGGRHPVFDKMLGDQFVANTTYLSEASNMLILTGPNMSGKSTYLHQVALIVILAQIGCFVPAKFASLRPLDRLLTCIGTGDNLESNASSLGRATATADGFAIAWSCCEFLLAQNLYTIVATHDHRLGELCSLYPNVKLCSLAVSTANSRLSFHYSVAQGSCNVTNYGLLLASVAGIPDTVIKEATDIAAQVDLKAAQRKRITDQQYAALRNEYSIVQRLLCLRQATLSDDLLREYLQNLKDSIAQLTS
eukprot:jgi/Chlat1/9056/Chrsp94S08358